MLRVRRASIGVVLGIAIAACGTPAYSPSPSSIEARDNPAFMQPISPRRATFSRREIRSFVIVVMQVHRIIDGAKHDPDQPSPQTLDSRIREVIAATPGIDRHRYMAIVDAVGTNPQLRARIRDMVLTLLRERSRVLKTEELTI